MYTAIQAKNIADEKYNHEYYKVYKRYVQIIMRRITASVKKGYTDWQVRYIFDNTETMTVNVLNQIAQELTAYGYRASMTQQDIADTKNKYYDFVVDWN